jgi:hypothetical protein
LRPPAENRVDVCCCCCCRPHNARKTQKRGWTAGLRVRKTCGPYAKFQGGQKQRELLKYQKPHVKRYVERKLSVRAFIRYIVLHAASSIGDETGCFVALRNRLKTGTTNKTVAVARAVRVAENSPDARSQLSMRYFVDDCCFSVRRRIYVMTRLAWRTVCGRG